MYENCPSTELCELLGKQIHGRLWDIWNLRADLPVGKQIAYVNQWLEQAGISIQDVPENLRPPFPELPKPQVPDKEPSMGRKAWNFAKALTRYVMASERHVTQEVYEARLATCDGCPFRRNKKCIHKKCGCNLEVKAGWKTESCPEGYWEE